MTENEVIIVDGISKNDYESLMMSCVKYAIISLPFTVDRMEIPDERKRARNIAKGKIAEALFKYFCNANGIFPDFDVCSTPFWTVDNRDFVLGDNEWDLKNNFYYCIGDRYSGKYVNFPALVPNKYDGDQWSKRFTKNFVGTNEVEFLFTFLKEADLMNGGKQGMLFFDINLSEEQHRFLRLLYDKYQGQPQASEPFSEDAFWKKFSSLGSMDLYTLHSRPSLIITAYANSNHWHLFQNTGPLDRTHSLRLSLQPYWYEKRGPNRTLFFLDGTLRTRIKNETCMVSQLPSFLSLYPHLKERIQCGHIQQV